LLTPTVYVRSCPTKAVSREALFVTHRPHVIVVELDAWLLDGLGSGTCELISAVTGNVPRIESACASILIVAESPAPRLRSQVTVLASRWHVGWHAPTHVGRHAPIVSP
jgi:hypothetical protein